MSDEPELRFELPSRLSFYRAFKRERVRNRVDYARIAADLCQRYVERQTVSTHNPEKEE